ncbi:chemotaxis protein [Streptomyces kunmingensis]|uniref:Chemotaxis protein n=1 Tax=Streptomyces kunmingensis TaxID=68225 RepID=A0ABU6CE79_9ACTN|nr:chemotaxis protein [Streptomyces kunmingensis]MEB3962922.1 chemotaxis protein [Streptomyces kunmingensis]
MHSSLNPEILRHLRTPRPYPAVSLAMPTHRRQPDNAQDPVRLNNLVHEAVRQLEADPAVTKERREDVVAQLKAAVADLDLAHARDGLIVFAAPGEHQAWVVDRPVPERVVLADTFLTRNLVAADAARRPYWVLAVAADRITLWNGRGERVTQDTAHGFPHSRSLERPDSERKERVGDLPSTFHSEETRQFFRDADLALADVLGSEPRSLYVTGDPAALALFTEAGSAAHGATQIPFGGLAQAAPEAVARAVAPARAEGAERVVAEALAELDRARGGNTYAAGVDEVWQKASDGRIHRLVVEENYRITVRAGEGHLEPAADDDLDAVHDIVDEIVESALETGAQVVFVPDETLADAGHVAAVLRF